MTVSRPARIWGARRRAGRSPRRASVSRGCVRRGRGWRAGAGLGSGSQGNGCRWPAFASAACRDGAAAAFAFPLRIGGIRAGVMGLYRDGPGRLSDFQLGDALIFADTAALLLLDPSGPSAGGSEAETGPAGQPADLALHRAKIDQATGMLTEQLGVGITEAFVRPRAYDDIVAGLQYGRPEQASLIRHDPVAPPPRLNLGDEDFRRPTSCFAVPTEGKHPTGESASGAGPRLAAASQRRCAPDAGGSHAACVAAVAGFWAFFCA
jgi:hypothetical protein